MVGKQAAYQAVTLQITRGQRRLTPLDRLVSVFQNLQVCRLNTEFTPVPKGVLSVLRGTNCDLVAIFRDISEDQMLTAAALRTVNTPRCRGTERIPPAGWQLVWALRIGQATSHGCRYCSPKSIPSSRNCESPRRTKLSSEIGDTGWPTKVWRFAEEKHSITLQSFFD